MVLVILTTRIQTLVFKVVSLKGTWPMLRIAMMAMQRLRLQQSGIWMRMAMEQVLQKSP